MRGYIEKYLRGLRPLKRSKIAKKIYCILTFQNPLQITEKWKKKSSIILGMAREEASSSDAIQS